MGAARRRTCWSRRMSKYPQFEITADDVFRAAAEPDFEFFADLILYGPVEMEHATRVMAANFLLNFLRGPWSTKRGKLNLVTLGKYKKIADRVAELKEQNGLESAITQVAQELCRPGKKPPQRTVWKAWEVHMARERGIEDIHRKLAEIRKNGGSRRKKRTRHCERERTRYRRKTNRLLKRKG